MHFNLVVSTTKNHSFLMKYHHCPTGLSSPENHHFPRDWWKISCGPITMFPRELAVSSSGFFATAPGATQCTKCPKGGTRGRMFAENGEPLGFLTIDLTSKDIQKLRIKCWLVVWLPFLISHLYWVANHPNWRSYFSEGFKPPTSVFFFTNYIS